MQTLQGAISLPCCRHPRQTHPMPFVNSKLRIAVLERRSGQSSSELEKEAGTGKGKQEPILREQTSTKLSSPELSYTNSQADEGRKEI